MMIAGIEKFKKTRKWLRLAFVAVPIISLIDLILPFLLKAIVNSQLKKLKGYRGEITSLHVSLLQHNIRLEGLKFEQVFEVTGTYAPIAMVDKIEVKFSWKDLWTGVFISDIIIVKPVIHVMVDQIKNGKSVSPTIPVIITSIQLTDGTIRITDYSIQPIIEIVIDDINANAAVLANVGDAAGELPSTINLDGIIDDGKLNINLKIDLLKDDPTFDLNAKLEGLDMSKLNDYFQHYGKFQVDKGLLDLFAEVAAKEGAFAGYVKPLIKDLEIGGDEERKSFLRNLWEGFLDTTTDLLSNPEKDQLGTKVPLEGTFRNPDVNVVYAVFEVLYNAFVEALKPSLDNNIDITSVDADSADNT